MDYDQVIMTLFRQLDDEQKEIFIATVRKAWEKDRAKMGEPKAPPLRSPYMPPPSSRTAHDNRGGSFRISKGEKISRRPTAPRKNPVFTSVACA